MKHFFSRKIILVFSLLISFAAVNSVYSGSSTKFIKVAEFTDDDVLFKKSKDLKQDGYAYDFLNAISRYSGYQYEFVKINRDEGAKALKEGKIDLIAFWGKNSKDSENILFSDLPTAKGNLVLLSKNGVTWNHVRIGTMMDQNVISSVRNYIERQHINAQIISYPDTAAVRNALDHNDVDLIAAMDLSIPEGFIVEATVETVFLYSAVCTSNRSLYNELNSIINQTYDLDPAFFARLTKRYISSTRKKRIDFTPAEQIYRSQHPVLRIALVKSQKPFCFLDPQSNSYKGIAIDFLKDLEAKSGLIFQYVKAATYAEALNMVVNGKADAIFGAGNPLQPSRRQSIQPSIPYYAISYTCVERKVPDTKGVTLALVKGYQFGPENIELDLNVKDVTWYDTAEACLDAVSKNSNVIAFVPTLEESYFTNSHPFTDFQTIPVSFAEEISIGLNKTLAPELCSLIDRTIAAIDKNMIENSILSYSNTQQNTIGGFISGHLSLTIIIGIIIVILIMTIIFLMIVLRIKSHKDREIRRAMNLANRDSMTGLYNRIAFKRLVQGHINNCPSTEISAFIMIDIDNFKRINDTCGHGTGDVVIVTIANTLLSFFRNADLKSRMGGDEFAVFMQNVKDLPSIEQKVILLLAKVSEQFPEEKFKVPVTCSIGIAVFDETHRDDFDTLYKKADSALYNSKHAGKNSFTVYHESLTS